MKLKKIKLSSIKVPPVRVTAVYDDELKQLLHDSLAAMGQQTPIVVVAAGEEFLLVDGLHRLDEARVRGDEVIDAVLFEGEPRDALLKNLVLNRVRGKTKASEMVMVIHELYDEYKMTIEELEERTGLSRSLVEKYLQVSTAAESVQEALDAEVIGIGAAYEISRLPSQLAQNEIMAKYQIWRFPLKDLKIQIDQVLSMIPESREQLAAAAPSAPRKYKCQVCSLEATLAELRPVMLCPSCYGDLWTRVHSAPSPTDVEAEAAME